MQREELEELLRYGERINLECKAAKSDIPKSVWETYSAFANTVGGYIILGIEEDLKEVNVKKRFTICGVENKEKICKDFWNTVNNEKVSSNLLTDGSLQIIEIDEKSVICVRIPQADYKQRPVYINGNPYRGTFKRNHEGDFHCTEDEIKAMIRDANDAGNDGIVLENYTMDDIDSETLKSYRIEFELKNPDHVWNNVDNEIFLRNLGGYAKNRKTGKEGLTVAGFLMFGKGLEIRERFDNIRMDYIDETNCIEGMRWSDRLTYDGMWENNLYNFYKRIMPKLVSDIKRPFRLEGMSRVDDTIVHKAVREAFVNLIIHSDYMVTGVLKVVKKENGFWFSNPGTLKLPIKDIYEGGNSKARNPRIQTMLRMLGLGDNIGSGFPTILNAWKEENWRKPDLSENPDLRQVDLKLWTISLMPQECIDALHKLLDTDYQNLEAEEQIILSTAYLEGNVTNQRLQSILDKHPVEIGKFLADLVDKEMLLPDGRGRGTTYSVNLNYQIKPQQLEIDNFLVDENLSLNQTDKIIYEYLQENEFITANQVMQITKIKTSGGVFVALKRLRDRKIIEMVRRGRSVYYHLIKK